jgi:hypothetical protein
MIREWLVKEFSKNPQIGEVIEGERFMPFGF